MSLFDQIMSQASGLDLGAVAARVGLSQEQVTAGARALLPQIADPDVDNHQATQAVAAQTGISASQLTALVPALLQQAQAAGASGGALENVLAGLGGGGGQQGSVLGNIVGAVDKDGDGNPVNDLLGMFNRT
jgi:hypothetical protein